MQITKLEFVLVIKGNNLFPSASIQLSSLKQRSSLPLKMIVKLGLIGKSCYSWFWRTCDCSLLYSERRLWYKVKL